jgi:hypothetical protein
MIGAVLGILGLAIVITGFVASVIGIIDSRK